MLGEDEWYDLQSTSSGEDWQSANAGDDECQTQKKPQKSGSAQRLNTLRTLRRSEREDAQGTKSIENKTTPEDLKTIKRIESKSMHDIENTTHETKIVNKLSSMPIEQEETRGEDSIQLSTDIKRETSDSMNLLKSTSKELFSLMKGLNSRQEDRNPMQLLDPDRVKTAAEVAKQIISCMRTSLDVAKFIKENE